MKLKVRSHTGKIGQLPCEIRCQIGSAIHNGIPAVHLVAWLNRPPEVQTILALHPTQKRSKLQNEPNFPCK